ncbi:MAG TPA: transcription termination/antitermination NusG family protein [Alphaproteobacteria bacterium]|nr:transcription termination/antitermination NusG family protein [Alphaproteobacteria bacterium]
MKRWYVVHTQAAAEAKARANLMLQRYETFLPCFRKRRRHARKIDTVLAPLFPRYLFVHLDLDSQSWRSINGTFGVVTLVTFDDRPSAVPEGVVESIRARCDGAGIMDLKEPGFARGQALTIEDGPMANLTGLFEKVSSDERVVLLIEMLGRALRVAVPYDAVRAA